MTHKNSKNLHDRLSDLKGRLLLVTLVLTGFVAQIAIIGPTSAPDSIERDNEENIARQDQVANIATQDHKKLKPLKVVSSDSPEDSRMNEASEPDNASPAIQGDSSTSASAANKNHRKNQSKNGHKEPERTTQRCLLLGLLFCN